MNEKEIIANAGSARLKAHTLLLASLLWLGVGHAAMAGRLEVSSDHVNVGEILQGVTKHMTVEIRNGGNNEIRLGQPVGSCSCSDIRLSKNRIKPGETVSLSVGILRSQLGDFNLMVLVKSDADNPELGISLQGTVKPMYSLRARWAGQEGDFVETTRLPPVSIDRPPELELRLEFLTPDDQVLSVSDLKQRITVDSSRFQVTDTRLLSPTHDTEGAGATPTILITMRGRDVSGPGIYKEEITLKLADQIVLPWPIEFRGLGSVWAVQQNVNLGAVRDKAVQRTVELRFMPKVTPWKSVEIRGVEPAVFKDHLYLEEITRSDQSLAFGVRLDPSGLPSSDDAEAFFHIKLKLGDTDGREECGINLYGLRP